MKKSRVIVIGSSAGGVIALKELVASLPADFGVPIFIVQHIAPQVHSYLPEILNHAGHLKAKHPEDGEQIRNGHIYIAPPDHHMLIEDDHILVKKGPKENRFRPSVDALFRSAAYTYKNGVIGIILTGMLDDGTSGMWAVNQMKGITIVQDPLDAMYQSMPQNVLEHVNVDYIVPLVYIPELLTGLAEIEVEEMPIEVDKNKELMKMEIDIAAQQNAFEKGIINVGEPSSLTCPECGGALNLLTEDKITRYRCHTGHAYSSESLMEEVSQMTEVKVWQTIRSLEERIILLEKSADKSRETGNEGTAVNFLSKATKTRKATNLLRAFLFDQLGGGSGKTGM
ncbi:chemotaxis protein CheB [Dyadobacter sediminis]|uniref:protein-glutamate methylesterase n=1 Tax=Dyadobacter sediminis TaxID=1493691 RepID=A0A5R9K9F8_9BACT|nr:chemotaxis protein CheB [Dyadobacter sediminis]TLU90620.1 chemotaxis protein CheB [Dyadobacter sediminis]GGC09287.1 protein-glutamate methylesterase [Dyadobacter sediminis]